MTKEQIGSVLNERLHLKRNLSQTDIMSLGALEIVVKPLYLHTVSHTEFEIYFTSYNRMLLKVKYHSHQNVELNECRLISDFTGIISQTTRKHIKIILELIPIVFRCQHLQCFIARAGYPVEYFSLPWNQWKKIFANS